VDEFLELVQRKAIDLPADDRIDVQTSRNTKNARAAHP
jgi:hypothetical protein